MSVAEAGRPERHDGNAAGPYTVPVDLLLLYTRGNQLLVGLRRGGFAAGEWDSPSVHLAGGVSGTVVSGMSAA
jgi:hypothetical protein